MDIEKFLELKPEVFYKPHLYIVKQMFQGNTAYRCGLSGGSLFKGADRVFGADTPGSLTGLLSRMTMYQNYWLPLKGTIYAALTIKEQLVSKPDDRLGTDYLGNSININRANQTLVRIREADFHEVLDKRGFRWQKDRKNELFVPGRKGVEELISAMRQIQGEEMYIFMENSYTTDMLYKGGSPKAATFVTDTFQKQMPPRTSAQEARVQTITIKLSKKAIEELKSSAPTKFAQLIRILDEARLPKQKKGPSDTPPPSDRRSIETIRIPRRQIDAIRDGNTQQKEKGIEKILEKIELDKRVTRSQTKAAAQPRRSARLNEK